MNSEKGKKGISAHMNVVINKYERRNSELEKRAETAKKRLSMIESAMPALIAVNMMKLAETGMLPTHGESFQNLFGAGNNLNTSHTRDGYYPDLSEEMLVNEIEKMVRKQKEMKQNHMKVQKEAQEREKRLRQRIELLEAKTKKDEELLKILRKNYS